MKTIEFTKLEIQNFKSITNLTIDFNNETMLKGQNGAGKTTVADAVWWVLFGKDSQGRTKFGVRPFDSQGNDIHKIDIEVKLTMLVNGEPKQFGRVSSEKWTTQRGSKEAVLTGNETTLTINESVVKTKEFQEELDAVLNEEDFKLLSNPMHFMKNLDDKQRREVLMKLAGDEEQIEFELKQRSQFSELVEEWNNDLNKNKSFAMFLDYLKNKSKTDNATLKSIPDQIHALESTLEELGSEESLNNLIIGYKAEIDKIDASINNVVEEPAWIEENIEKAKTLKNKVMELENERQKEYSDKVNEVHEQRKLIKNSINKKDNELNDLKIDLSTKENKLKNLARYKEQLLEDYRNIKNKEFVAPEVNKVCYACGQDLLGVDETAIVNHAEEHFNEQKQKDIALIIEKGNANNIEIEEIEKSIEPIKMEINSVQNEITRLKLSLDRIVDAEVTNSSKEFIKLENEIEDLQEKVMEYRLSNKIDNSDAIQQKQSYMAMIGDAQRKLGQLNQQKATKNKIRELLEKEELLREQKIRFEVLINDALDFENEKNVSFERNLSTKFSSIKWRLFEQQVNGGFRNVCYPLLNGVPYGDQSTGEKIFTGVDIIKTFQEVEGIQVPIIIDNKESLSLDLGLTNQTINMYVDETLPKLAVL